MIALLVAIALWPGKRYKNNSINWVLLAFFVVICLSYFVAYDQAAAGIMVWEYFKLMVLFFVILLTVRDEKDLKNLVIGFLAVVAVYVGKSLWEYLVHGRHVYRMGFRRLIGIDQTYNDPNTFAATILYSLPFAWALWQSNPSKRLRQSLIFFSIMSMVAIALTGSRSGMVVFIFFLMLLWLKSKRKALGAVGLFILLVIGWFLLPDDIQTRMQTIFDDSINPQAAQSAQGRIEGFRMGWELFTMRPVTGWGAGNSAAAVVGVLHYGTGVQLHNLYGQILAELGIMGLIPFLLMLVLLVRNKNRIAKALDINDVNSKFLLLITGASINTMWLLLFNGLFGHNLYRYTWIWISAVMVLAVHFAIQKTTSTQSAPRLAVTHRIARN